jgi:hypothetical protein
VHSVARARQRSRDNFHRAAIARNRSQRDVSIGKLRGLGRDCHIAQQGDIGGETEGVTVDRGNLMFGVSTAMIFAVIQRLLGAWKPAIGLGASGSLGATFPGDD